MKPTARRFTLGLIVAFLSIACSPAGAESGPGFEFSIPDFDHDGVAATWVVSAPAKIEPGATLPLILDFHAAIAPSRKGANITRAAVWEKFAEAAPAIVVGLNGRTRAWGTIKGEKDDRAFADRVLAEVLAKYPVDPARIYLAGFSSGSDYLCRGPMQEDERFAGSLVVCPGPPSVVGLRGGALVSKKGHPFLFATGEEDYVRKSGAFEGYRALLSEGSPTLYREVAGKAHEFFGLDEYLRLFSELERLAGRAEPGDPIERAREAFGREDFLLARKLLAGVETEAATALDVETDAAGQGLLDAAETVDAVKEPGRALEAWWRLGTQFHAHEEFAARAKSEMEALAERIPNRELYLMRKAWFRRRAPRAPAERDAEDSPLFRFDRYLTLHELYAAVEDLARRFPGRARLTTIGQSVEGREIKALEITNMAEGEPGNKPAVYVQGGIHGNEICSTMAVLYFAWQLAANPERSRGTERLLEDVTVYLVPAMNPDAVHHFMAEPHSHWRPRFNYRPHDADGDGRIDEDRYEDLNGDGEIGLMYAPDPAGPYVLIDGRLKRGAGEPRYRLVAREGIDNDGDGKFSEDRPGGVDLNRNFPVGFTPRKQYEGFRGPEAASEPETRAVMAFVESHPNIALFLDYHSNGNCFFFWTGPEKTGDEALYGQLADRAMKILGYPPKPLTHTGAGLTASWAYGAMGIPAAIVELESFRGRRASYADQAWGAAAFQTPRPFDHPQLGEILIGNDQGKFVRQNLHPKDLFWQVDRNWAWLKAELAGLPKLSLVGPRIVWGYHGMDVSGEVHVEGAIPLDSEQAAIIGRGASLQITAEGARIESGGEFEIPAPGRAVRFDLSLRDCEETITLRISHPRGGTLELPILRERVPTIPARREYVVEKGYTPPEKAVRASNGFFENGVAPEERGPVFKVPGVSNEIRTAVLLGEWEDLRHAAPAKAFEWAYFSERSQQHLTPTRQHFYGSVRDFYDEMSFGRVQVTGKVFDWVTLPGKYAEYRDASFGSQVLHERMVAAVRARDGQDALEGYDAIAFVWAGNVIRRTSMLWPMRLNLKDPRGVVAFKSSELFRGQFAAIGVACHELGHTFGVNDKYGLGASENPLGLWCLIGKGTHGAGSSGYHRPFPFCAWCKSVLGWLDPVVIDPSVPQKLALRPVTHNRNEAYRILIEPDGSEYLLLENRRREGFMTELPSAGLAVLHVGPNDKPSAPQGRVRLLPAHGLPPAGRSDPAEPERIAWPQEGKTELTVKGVRIGNIRLVDDVVYFEVCPAE